MANIKLKKSKELPLPDKDTLKMLVEFIELAAKMLELGDEPIVITLLKAAPPQKITTGAFNTGDNSICCIIENRHFIDFTRTIAHELTHLQQKITGKLVGDIPEIGGDIEDEANYMAGRICKSFIKNKLTPENKRFLGLGSF